MDSNCTSKHNAVLAKKKIQLTCGLDLDTEIKTSDK